MRQRESGREEGTKALLARQKEGRKGEGRITGKGGKSLTRDVMRARESGSVSQRRNDHRKAKK